MIPRSTCLIPLQNDISIIAKKNKESYERSYGSIFMREIEEENAKDMQVLWQDSRCKPQM